MPEEEEIGKLKKGRSILALMMTVVLAMSVLSGCGGEKASSDENTLYVFNWSEYVPQEVYDMFEEETGIHVVETTYSSNEEMLAKLVAGGTDQYDIAVASNYVIEALKQQDLIQKLDTSSMENFKNLDSRILGMDYDPNNEYTVPYMSTVTVVAVNKQMMSDLGLTITSLNDLTDPALENNVVVVDDCREVVGVALKALGEDADTQDQATIEGTADWLKALALNVKLYDNDTAFSALATNEVAAGLVYNMDAGLAMDENDQIEVVETTEPCEMSIDNFVLCSGSTNQEAAQQFIDFMMRPDVYALCLESFPALCLNTAALEEIGDEYKNRPAATMDDPIVQNARLIQDVGEAASIYDSVFAGMKN